MWPAALLTATVLVGLATPPKASAAPERQLRDRVDEKIARTLTTEYA